MKVKDRIISFLLTVVMVVGLLPLGQVANAAGNYSASFYAYNYSTSNYTAHDTIYIRNALGNAKVGYDSASFDTRIYMYNDGDESWEYNNSCFTIPASCSWLHLGWASPEELQNGNVQPGRRMNGVCTLLPLPGLTAGTYSTTITFNDVNGHISKTIDVIFIVEPDPDFSYTVHVNNGTANVRNGYVWQPIDEAKAGTEIQLVADSFATKVFNNWTFNQPVTFTQGASDSNSTTYITMPPGNFEATANYVDVYSSQPSDGFATVGLDYTVTWSLNKVPTSDKYRLYSVDGDGNRSWIAWVNATSATISGAGKTDGLTEIYCVSIDYNGEQFFSDNFNITWKAADTPDPIPTYSISVNNGVAEYQDEPNSYGIRPWLTTETANAGTDIRLSASEAPAGKEFDKWVVNSGAITLADATSPTTTFTMPAEDVEVTATYKDIAVTTYNITVNSGTADVTTPASGATVTITAGTAPAGKEFDKWVVDSGTITLADATSATTTFTMPAEDVEVTATYKDIVVTAISIATPGKTAYTVGDSLDVSGMEIKVDYSDGSSKTIPVTTAMVSGFDSSAAAASQTLTITYEGKTTTYNVSISAVTPTTFTVTFNTNGGSAVASQTVADGSKAVKPDTDPTKEGCTFDGWYQDATFTAAFDFNTAITADTTIYAKWTESTAPGTIYYTVVSGANGTWTEGDIVVTVKRSEDDEHCIDYFTGVKIDDIDLVNGTDYTAVAGSTVVTIKGSTLESLSKGGHMITVTFKDGTAVTSITLKDKASGTNTSGSSAIPSTGETTSKYIGVAVLCFVASGALFGVVLLERKKRKCAQ